MKLLSAIAVVILLAAAIFYVPETSVASTAGPTGLTVSSSLRPLIEFNEMSGVSVYDLQIASDESFNNIVKDMPDRQDENIFAVKVQVQTPAPDLSSNTTYHLRVKADSESWSQASTLQFTTP